MREPARTALLEVGRCGLPERFRPQVGDPALDRPADARNEAERLTCHCPEAEPRADNGEDLGDSLAVDQSSTPNSRLVRALVTSRRR